MECNLKEITLEIYPSKKTLLRSNLLIVSFINNILLKIYFVSYTFSIEFPLSQFSLYNLFNKKIISRIHI